MDQKPMQNTAADLVEPCAIDLWSAGIDQHAVCADALAQLILDRPARVRSLSSPEAAERCLRSRISKPLKEGDKDRLITTLRAMGQIARFTGRVDAAISCVEEVLECIVGARGAADKCADAVGRELTVLYRLKGDNTRASKVNHRLRVRPLLARNDPGDFGSLRSYAFNAFEDGSFAAAAEIYTAMLHHPMERAGTHAHLARVLVAMGREQAAAVEVARGLQHLQGADRYVPARLHYLYALLETMAGRDATVALGRLQRSASTASTRNAWLLGHVMAHARSRLTPESYEFFSRLGEMLGRVCSAPRPADATRQRSVTDSSA